VTFGAAGPEERLWRREDPEVFNATILAAAEQLDVQPLAVKKDYWVCQALRAVVTVFPGQIVFKGGTSLEKLRLIQRFSEDLDLLVVANLPNRNQGKNRLKEMWVAAETKRATGTWAPCIAKPI
jgi:predicted nucleotidyltransferase component of viral defense system